MPSAPAVLQPQRREGGVPVSGPLRRSPAAGVAEDAAPPGACRPRLEQGAGGENAHVSVTN